MRSSLMILMILFTAGIAPAQTVVRDHNTRRQIQRLTHQRWEKFRPRWYFVLFHNRYRKGEDRRIIRQLTPTLATMQANRDQASEENSELEQVTTEQLADAASRQAPLPYWLHFQQQLERYHARFTREQHAARLAGVPAPYLQILQQEAIGLTQSEELVVNGYMAPGDLQQSLRRLTGEWEVLIGRLQVLTRYYALPKIP